MEKPSLEIGNSNWAIKEGELLGYNRVGNDYLPIPITMTRASLGTRVNPEGLVEDVELLGSEEVTNGDFSGGTTGWTEVGDFAISGGKASITSASQYSQLTSQQGTNFLTSGKQYKLQVDIETLSISGGFAYRVTGGAVTPILTSDLVGGVYTTYFTMISDGYIWFQTTGSYTGLNVTIDNVSVKEATIDNLARVDYDGTSSLLVEPQRTNNLTASQDLTNLFWNSINTETIVASTVLSPDGTTFGFKAIPSTSTSTHYVDYDYGFLSMPSGVEVTYSVFAKPFGYTNFQLATSSGMNSRYQNFELTGNGVLGSGSVNGATIKKIGDWYRCTITEGTTSTTPRVLNIATPSSGLGRNPSFTGNGTDGVLLWGAQMEEGAYGTSYIPNLSTTSGSTVTRVQDQYSKTGISNLINSTEGCVFGEGNFAESDSGSGYFYFVSLSDGTPNNRLEIRQSNTNLQFLWRVATYQDNIITSGVDVSSNFKFALSYSSANIKFYVNGNLIGTINTPTLWTANTLNRMAFDNGSGGDILSGKVKQLQVFKTALTDDELTILTGTSGVHFFPSYASMAEALTYTIE